MKPLVFVVPNEEMARFARRHIYRPGCGVEVVVAPRVPPHGGAPKYLRRSAPEPARPYPQTLLHRRGE